LSLSVNRQPLDYALGNDSVLTILTRVKSDLVVKK